MKFSYVDNFLSISITRPNHNKYIFLLFADPAKALFEPYSNRIEKARSKLVWGQDRESG